VFVGDAIGSIGGGLSRGPEAFTADADAAERSRHRLLEARGARMYFGHGPELDDPWAALDALLA
jgi:glyoxylase-like metal-dependent hydrolase (beta-lactamase superfamily II)